MSFKYGFYNSVNGDRKYDAVDFGRIFDGVINDGVFGTVGKGMIVQPGNGMVVVVGSGKAWFEHTWSWLTADLPVVISTANSVYSRIDAIVLETNPDTRVNEIKTLEGSPASTAVKPTLTDHQHALAYVTVRAGTTSILAGDIEVVVGTSQTPIVTGALQLLNLDPVIQSYTNKWGQDFHEWFTHLQNELDEHQAAHLQNQIDHLDGFHVGDLLMTKNAHLDDTWLLANGQYVAKSDYPDLEEYISPETSVLSTNSNQGLHTYFTRIVNGKLVLGGYHYYTSDKSSYILVADVSNGEAKTTKFAPENQHTNEEIHFYYVTYNDITRKYIALAPSTNRNSPYGQGAFYQANELFTGSIYTPNPFPYNSYIAKYPYQEGTPGCKLFDFIYYQGYYFTLERIWDGVSTYSHVLLRTSDLTSENWDVVTVFSNQTQYIDEARFSIIDNHLYFYIVNSSSGLVDFWSLSSPTGTITHSQATVSTGSTDAAALGFTKNLIKIDGHIYAEALTVNGNQHGPLLGNKLIFEFDISSSGVLQSVTPLSQGFSIYTCLPCALFETDDNYWMVDGSRAYYSINIYRQNKTDFPHLDLTNLQNWELVHTEDNTASETGTYFAGIILENSKKMFTYALRTEATGATYNQAIKIAQADALKIPSVSTIATGFSNYIKVKA